MDLNQLGKWVFQELGGASARRDPNEAELFKAEQADDGEYAGTDALVREVIQNSLDARVGEEPVSVRIAFHTAYEAPPPERMGHYFQRLRAPLLPRGVELGAHGNPLISAGFLVCEDFGTRGLGGEPLRGRDPLPGDTTCNDFFWFWRNIGRSGKTGDDLGRWGLGKTVYRAPSRTGCMLGLTIRAADHRRGDGPKKAKRHVAPPVAFAKASLLASVPPIESNVISTDGPPSLDAAFDPAVLQSLRRQFSAGERLFLRVRMNLQRRTAGDVVGEIDVHLQRHPDGQRRDSYYVREGMTITKLNSSAAQRGIQALVNVNAGPLASLLGDAEGPSHEDWDTSSERPDRTWKNWKYRVRFIRRIVENLVEVLNPPADEPDFDLLSDIFSIERTQSPQRSRPAPGEQSPTEGRLAQLTPPERWFRVSERSGGFALFPSKTLAVPAKAAVRISVSYDLPSGNPLKQWSKYDFEFNSKNAPIKCTGKNVEARILNGNEIEVTVKAADFSFGVEGFDRNRDLFIRVDEVDEPAEVVT